MKEIVFLSGKGGTGKTSITAAFAVLATSPVVADCDVDAADLHLVLEPNVKEAHSFIGGQVARVDMGKCTRCGYCTEICRFRAITIANDGSGCRIDQTACEGCGVCAFFCPNGAIAMEDMVCGHWFVSQTRVGLMVHAKLSAGGENSGKLVTLVRNRAKSIAQSTGAGLILTDGPPGIGCPAIASLAGASRAVAVTEPTVSGIHDLKRIVKLTEYFRVPSAIIINKSDINLNKAKEIKTFAAANHLEVLGSISYDPVFTQAQLAGRSVIEYSGGAVSSQLRDIWDALQQTTD